PSLQRAFEFIHESRLAAISNRKSVVRRLRIYDCFLASFRRSLYPSLMSPLRIKLPIAGDESLHSLGESPPV
ncbi:MAG: hypothetical protein AAFQ29_02060, partial [Pseudomonadota bacterium]